MADCQGPQESPSLLLTAEVTRLFLGAGFVTVLGSPEAPADPAARLFLAIISVNHNIGREMLQSRN